MSSGGMDVVRVMDIVGVTDITLWRYISISNISSLFRKGCLQLIVCPFVRPSVSSLTSHGHSIATSGLFFCKKPGNRLYLCQPKYFFCNLPPWGLGGVQKFPIVPMEESWCCRASCCFSCCTDWWIGISGSSDTVYAVVLLAENVFCKWTLWNLLGGPKININGYKWQPVTVQLFISFCMCCCFLIPELIKA